MYSSSKLRSADKHSLDQQYPNLHDTFSPQYLPRRSNSARRCLDSWSSTRCEDPPLDHNLKALSRCSRPLQPSNSDVKKDLGNSLSDLATGRTEGLNERMRDLRRLLEADSIYFCSGFHLSRSMYRPELPPIDDKLHLDITLSYESSSDFSTYPSFDSIIYGDPPYDHQPENRSSNQTTDLRGIGQWTETEGTYWSSWQPPLHSLDTEGQDLDLTIVHAFADMEQYIQTREDNEGVLNYQMYSSLP